MMTKREQINYMVRTNDTLRDALEVERNEASSLRKDVYALTRGVETSYEVTTITRTGTRNTRGFKGKVDALHWATDKRIGDAFDRVTIAEVESRRQYLKPDGAVIQPFGN